MSWVTEREWRGGYFVYWWIGKLILMDRWRARSAKIEYIRESDDDAGASESRH